ncbi:MAG: ribosomal-processing cysteine protease Prp [Streptococcaceae bacterium]|jgi:uncharacterized protein YsxB (DUF464 family)|nr:ribosomal-processing cysteine protease Prp [Streptococcaceae bacterium]
MIKAKIHRKSNEIVSYELSGHAMSGEYGHDIVCSAVSVLSITTANGLERLTGVEPITEMSSGYLYVELQENLSSEQREIARILLENFQDAMLDVENEYGQYVKVIKE